MNNLKKVKISGFNITPYPNINTAVQLILEMHLDKGHMAIAINPEKIIHAMDNSVLNSILHHSDILYADGIGIVKAMSKKTGIPHHRISGCELWEALMCETGKLKLPVFIIGSSPSVNLQTCKKLRSVYGVNITGYQHGFFDDEDDLINRIIVSEAKIVTVALGSPKQEIFINRCREAGVKAFFMGVGGTYDVFTGNMRRAPKIFRQLGLEWCFRLISQPSRIFRQKRLLIFFMLYIRNKL